MNTHKRICIMGLGYIGLPTAALLANRGYNVHGVDIVEQTVRIINRGEIHIVEPELDTFVRAAVSSGNLRADTKPTKADIYIIAVPTPFKGNHEPDIGYVVAATEAIVPYLETDAIVILESTSPVGTTHTMEKIIRQARTDLVSENGELRVHLAHCPERVLPGHIMRELVENDRIVGGITRTATEKAANFYESFVEGEVLRTDAKTAEMTKLTENAFRDLNIAFANELSILCDRFEIDVWELIRLANRHPRVNILQPGAGVGGHCIAVDPWFIVHAGKEDARLIRTAREVNSHKSLWVIEKIEKHASLFREKEGRPPRIACMGLAFKPDIDDLRESPALAIARSLKAKGYDIVAVEPNIDNSDEFTLLDPEEAVATCDVIVYLVKHKEFLSLPCEDALDFCGVCDRAQMA